MRIMRLAAVMLWLSLIGASSEAADEPGYRVYSKAAKFEDVRDDVKDAIINRGFVIDYVGHLSAMLERTAEAAGNAATSGPGSPYRNAEYLLFCPSKLTHEAVKVSPLAIANCPISIFVYEAAAARGTVVVGYRLPPATASPALSESNDRLVALLDEIASEATKK